MRLIIFIILSIFVLVFVFFNSLHKYKVTYVKSDIDGADYLVREMEDKQNAANLLARIKSNMFKLVEELKKYEDTKYKEYKPYIDQLQQRIKNVVINESSDDRKYTSYSVNKGEQVVFCLRSKYDSKLHEPNLVMYVALHEMGHIGCPEYGHGDLFKKVFAFFTKVAIETGLYTKIDFSHNPFEYCGIMITESIV